MLVVGSELHFSVSLVDKSPLTAVPDEVGGGRAPQREGEHSSESERELLFEILVAVEELLKVSAEVSVLAMGLVSTRLPLRKE